MGCPFYKNGCAIKRQVELPVFRQEHDCGNNTERCSFFAKEKLKQIETDFSPKILIRQVSNPYLVKADVLVYPANNLLDIDDPILNKMTLNQAQDACRKIVDKKMVKMGYVYGFPAKPDWKIKQKYLLNAVIAGASRLVNESDVSGAMKKALLQADEMEFQTVLVLPCDNGTHDISLTSSAQLSAIFLLAEKHAFKHIKSIYICMQDEESEQAFIEYYNRIFRR